MFEPAKRLGVFDNNEYIFVFVISGSV
jgi:hypothetical protein